MNISKNMHFSRIFSEENDAKSIVLSFFTLKTGDIDIGHFSRKWFFAENSLKIHNILNLRLHNFETV